MNKIERRSMLKAMGAISLGSFIPATARADAGNQLPGRIRTIKTDILVVGGGTAGVIAAIQSARAGCATVLVENGGQLGGTITTGGVAFPGLFYAWGKQIIRGIGWELVTDTVLMDDGKLPDFHIPTGKQHWRHQVRLNPYLYVMLAEEKCLNASVQIRYYETPVDVRFKKGNWEVETIGKGTHTRIIANQLIDCTGNASVVSLAGFPLEREEEIQPGTLMFRIGGYSLDQLDTRMIQEKYEQEVAKGKLVGEEFRNNIVALLRSAGDNIQHIAGADSSTSEAHTRTNIRGRMSLLDTLRFLRTLPGCERTQLLSMQTETAVRETYRITGEYRITHDDYVSGRQFNDSLSWSFYPIDLHDKHGVVPKHLEEHTVATIPLRALVPKGSKNLLVAGRCVSSDRLANSALRVQASCMGMGQAAAAAAVLASRQGTSPLDVPVGEIKSLLKDHDAIIPE